MNHVYLRNTDITQGFQSRTLRIVYWLNLPLFLMNQILKLNQIYTNRLQQQVRLRHQNYQSRYDNRFYDAIVV